MAGGPGPRWRPGGGGKWRGGRGGSIPFHDLGGGGVWRQRHGGERRRAAAAVVAALWGPAAARARGKARGDQEGSILYLGLG
jgi:hypothetical protein